MIYEKIDILIQILLFALICTPFSTGLNQSIKGLFNWNSTLFGIISIINSMLISIFMCDLFSDYNLKYSIFVGLVVVIGAKSLYEQLNSMGVVKSVNDNKNSKTVTISLDKELK